MDAGRPLSRRDPGTQPPAERPVYGVQRVRERLTRVTTRFGQLPPSARRWSELCLSFASIRRTNFIPPQAPFQHSPVNGWLREAAIAHRERSCGPHRRGPVLRRLIRLIELKGGGVLTLGG